MGVWGCGGIGRDAKGTGMWVTTAARSVGQSDSTYYYHYHYYYHPHYEYYIMISGAPAERLRFIQRPAITERRRLRLRPIERARLTIL